MNSDRDPYAEGWIKGIESALVIVNNSRSLDDARDALAALIHADKFRSKGSRK